MSLQRTRNSWSLNDLNFSGLVLTQDSEAADAKEDEKEEAEAEDEPSFFEEDCDDTTGIQSFYEYPTFVHQSFGIDFDDDDDDGNDGVDDNDDREKVEQAKPEPAEQSHQNENAGESCHQSCDDEKPSSSEDFVQNRQTSVTPVERLADESPAPPQSQASCVGPGINEFQSCFIFHVTVNFYLT